MCFDTTLLRYKVNRYQARLDILHPGCRNKMGQATQPLSPQGQHGAAGSARSFVAVAQGIWAGGSDGDHGFGTEHHKIRLIAAPK
jgi:hypothetical protein